jgi:uncharacterized protein (TIGR02757 family)
MKPKIDRKTLDSLYRRYNRRSLVHPDPLELLYEYEEPADREIVGLIAASLAYGRVAQILKSVGEVLVRIESPARFLAENSPARIDKTLAGFKHRFTTGKDLARLLVGAGTLTERHGSLHLAFANHQRRDDATVIPALTGFVNELTNASGPLPHLLADPCRGSACKRLHLFLRWMVRKDNVDPGGWDRVDKARLIVPLDVHMMRICTALGLTARKSSDGKTAIEITNGFAAFTPGDPVKYDFTLTRFGIRQELSIEELVEGRVVI